MLFKHEYILGDIRNALDELAEMKGAQRARVLMSVRCFLEKELRKQKRIAKRNLKVKKSHKPAMKFGNIIIR